MRWVEPSGIVTSWFRPEIVPEMSTRSPRQDESGWKRNGLGPNSTTFTVAPAPRLVRLAPGDATGSPAVGVSELGEAGNPAEHAASSQRTETIVHGPASDLSSDLSPDGRWLAYDSNESGQYEVLVRPYPNADSGRWVISMAGGRQPVWSRDGRELFYRDFSGALIAVPVTATPRFRAGRPMKLLDGGGFAGAGPTGSSQTYDVARDGRFLMLKTAAGSNSSLVIVHNWVEALKRPAPPKSGRRFFSGPGDDLPTTRAIDGSNAHYFAGWAAATTAAPSARRDWNGRLRTTSRTSVWKP